MARDGPSPVPDAGQVLAIKQLGVGLAIAVLGDATSAPVWCPVAMKMLGERNWWAPAPLGRFHKRFFSAARHTSIR